MAEEEHEDRRKQIADDRQLRRMKREGATALRLATLIAAASTLSACTDRDGATRVLEAAGYSDIRVGGWAPLTCDDKGDSFATSFAATGPTGIRVSGAVCGGFLKGNTIRTR